MEAAPQFKETKELVNGLIKIGARVVELTKDGAQLDDALKLAQELMGDGELALAVKAAYEGYDKVDDELKDFDLKKGIALLLVLVPELLDVVEKISKKKEA